MKIKCVRWDPVWIRTAFELEVPDDFDFDDPSTEERGALINRAMEAEGMPLRNEEVTSLETCIDVTLPDGTEIEL